MKYNIRAGAGYIAGNKLFEVAELEQQLRSGEVSPQFEVRAEGQRTWAPISSVLDTSIYTPPAISRVERSTSAPAAPAGSSPAPLLFALAGAACGAFLGFLLRPSVMGQQMPLDAMINGKFQGEVLSGMAEGLARASMNYMIAGAVVGVILGFAVGTLLARSK